jgi:Leucine-rich repeat (LRR) protein
MKILWGLLAVWCVLVVGNEQDIRHRNVRFLEFEPDTVDPGFGAITRLSMKQIGGPRVPLSRIWCITSNFNSPPIIWNCHLPGGVSEVLIDYEVICKTREVGGKTDVESCRIEYSLADHPSLVDFLLTMLAVWLILSVCVLIVDPGWATLKNLYFFESNAITEVYFKKPDRNKPSVQFERKLTIYEHGLIILMPHMSFETLNSLVGVSDIITVAATCMIRRKILQQGCLRLNIRIKHFPPSIAQLSALKELSLHGCYKLKRFPDTLAGMTSLEKLDLSKSSIASLPPSIGRLSALKELSLSGCYNLTSIPDTLAGLMSLEKMDLSESSIASLPQSIGHLSSLKELSLSGCNVSMSIPDTLAGLTSLEKLDLSALWIKSLPPSIGQLSSLKVLTLCVCRQLTSIPDSLSGLTSLEKMDLAWTSIKSLPLSIGQLSSLKDLSLFLCRGLTSIPDSLSGLPLLEKIDIRYTNIQWPPPGRPDPFARGVVIH